MNFWLWAATAFLILLFPVGVTISYGSATQRMAAFTAGSLGGTFALLLLAQGYGRTEFYDIAFTAALLSVIGTLVYAQMYERWL
jgi:multisubunit Na+/H+ antiporter MnhF subunit